MQLLTIEDVAVKLKVSKRTVYEWIRTGKLEAVKAGSLWRISEQALQDFLVKGNRKEGRQE